MKEVKGIRDIWEKLLGMGKDRYVILLCIGLVFVLIASSLESRQKENEKEEGTGTGKAESAYDEKDWIKTDNADLYDSMFGRSSVQTQKGMTGEGAELSFEKSGVTAPSIVDYGTYYQRQLEDLLGRMDGVGKVRVFVSMKSSEELILERNNPYNRRTEEETSGDGQRMTTEIESDSQVVFYENSDGKETPIVIKRYAPKVEGVAVLAQGADNPKVSANISQFLVALFDIPAHKIKVAKYHT